MLDFGLRISGIGFSAGIGLFAYAGLYRPRAKRASSRLRLSCRRAAGHDVPGGGGRAVSGQCHQRVRLRCGCPGEGCRIQPASESEGIQRLERPAEGVAGQAAGRPPGPKLHEYLDRRRRKGVRRNQGQNHQKPAQPAEQSRHRRDRHRPNHAGHECRPGRPRSPAGNAGRVVEPAHLPGRATAGNFPAGGASRQPGPEQFPGKAWQKTRHQHGIGDEHHAAGSRERPDHARRRGLVPVFGAQGTAAGHCGQRAGINSVSGRRCAGVVSGRSIAV